MIQLLATKYRKSIAFFLLLAGDLSFFLSAEAGKSVGYPIVPPRLAVAASTVFSRPLPLPEGFEYRMPRRSARRVPERFDRRMPERAVVASAADKSGMAKHSEEVVRRLAIGGPNQPEMTSFKPVDMNNMVNLFTGDFSYNIPLMDVGGYPVNLFYNGEVGLEQEASWVGLGWNINPGNINRNMRGIPDDFNGDEKLVQKQNMKSNVTVGVGVVADAEAVGIKFLPANFTLNTGVSWNNYLGIALDLGVKGGVNFKVADKAGSEKNLGLSLGLSLSADLNSRSGLTLSPSASLTGSAFMNDKTFSFGPGLTTSYNSRSGIKALQITEQLAISKISEKTKSMEGFDLITHVTSQNSAALFSSSISFARPSYIPSIRIPMVNDASSGHFQLGSAIFGLYASAEAEVYKQTSSVDPGKITQCKRMVGYLYSENALGDPNAVMDFTRLNDREVTPNTPVISAPQYSYDVFSIQGEGTGGSIRAYRSDPGYVRDNATGSRDKSEGAGVDIGVPGHYGANFNMIKTPSTIGEWISGNNLHGTIPFQAPAVNSSWENVYFRNPGEAGVLDNNEYNNIGGTNLTRFELSGDPHSVHIESRLDSFSKTGAFTGSVDVLHTTAANRKKRTQVIDFLTADNASNYGLDKQIKNYDNQTLLDASNNLRYATIPRVDESVHLRHQISEINVTEANGRRYIYGIPVYNTVQEDFTFTVGNTVQATAETADKVSYDPTEAEPSSNPNIVGSNPVRDGYAQVTRTPPYAHSFLLSGILSPDYVDVTGDGITDDDPGNAVKFNYTKIADLHRWRTPMEQNQANFNAGNRTEVKDDKGLITYGERESWYMHSIESKTMIAVFTLQDREDGKSVTNDMGGVDATNHSLKCLKQIDLYAKSDLKRNGLAAKPIKTVNFVYNYTLCKGTPDNPGFGKLTLQSIYFTFNKQARSNKNMYVFSYGTDAASNPDYAVNASDRWGTYKAASLNPGGIRNNDYPYTPQDQLDGQGQIVSPKATLDQNAGAWSLKKILLPSGGQMEVTYESDSYAYVQNKRAMDMMSIAGFGHSSTAFNDQLYSISGSTVLENDYLFVKVPEPCTTVTDVYQKYLLGVEQLAVRMKVNMPKGQEYLTSYANFECYGVYDAKTIWIKLRDVNNRSPLSLTAVEFLREQLPGQAFPGYDVSNESSLESIGDALAGMIDAVTSAFSDPVNHLRGKGLAKSVQLDHSWVRLNDPDGCKFGGGQRVKSIKLKDNWQPMMSTNNPAMTGTYNTVYDQEYDYTTTETFNGATRKISSGVASYEPSMGGEENPFQTIIQVANKLPLGPTSYGAVEMPMLESFFPSPVVGYSKVTVRSVPSNVPTAQQKSRSGIGRQVTEFYTAKDFPVYYSNTSFDAGTDLQAHDASTANFFYKYAFDSRSLSQGFLVATNDMHGKLRSQSSYAETDPNLRVSYTENIYRNTGANGLYETFDFVSAAQGGAINRGNLGIDVELMTDTREFTVSSSSLEVQAQIDLFPVILPIWLPFIWPVTGNSQNIYRAVTTTKVITYHSVLDSVTVMDKGSRVGTKNMLFDSETGHVIVTRTNNEFDKPVYKTSYPAWWAYSGMGPAYRNTGIVWTGINISDGKLIGGTVDPSLLESGDELYVTGMPVSVCPPASPLTDRLWVLDKNKNNPPFPAGGHDFIFIDKAGMPYTNNNIASMRIIRSGKRNMLEDNVATITSMVSPIVTDGSSRKLSLETTSVLNATAMEYNEKWQTDNGMIGKFTPIYNSATCTTVLTPDCNGQLAKNINPYMIGLLGNFRGYRTMAYYDNRSETDPATATNLPQNGFLANFTPYWDFNSSNALVPNTSLANWMETNRVTRINARGLELETKNAANIYTAAQYGYGKTLPVAVTNNSPSYQSIYEGFEDRGYTQGLDNDQTAPCPSGQPDFVTMPNATLVNTDNTGFSAHTGKYVLGVTGGQTASLSMPIVGSDNLNFNLAFGSNTSQVLNNPGVNSSITAVGPNANMTFPQTPVVTTSNSTVDINMPMYVLGSNEFSNQVTEGDFSWDGWLYIPTAGTYTFKADIKASQFFEGPGSSYTSLLNVILIDQQGNTYGAGAAELSVMPDPSTLPTVEDSSIQSVILCPGYYHVVCLQGSGHVIETGAADNGTVETLFEWKCTNSDGPFYQNLNMVDGCTTTTPIVGDASMLNTNFSLPAGKPMVVSAWVREDQSSPSSGATNLSDTYSGSKITYSDGSQNITLLPQGPIIEGWQRYEGRFTPSIGATTGTLSFASTTNVPIYFDDIRIHPFNAEMKSYVYDPVNLRLIAELDANNYASFYEYDEEGTLVRTKAETQRGIKTIKESRSAKQKNLTTVQ
jgi:hypothetical protein